MFAENFSEFAVYLFTNCPNCGHNSNTRPRVRPRVRPRALSSSEQSWVSFRTPNFATCGFPTYRLFCAEGTKEARVKRWFAGLLVLRVYWVGGVGGGLDSVLWPLFQYFVLKHTVKPQKFSARFWA